MACRLTGVRRPTIRDLGSVTMANTPPQTHPSPVTWFLEEDEDATAALSGNHIFPDHECHMCGRHLQSNRDIYMYRGDTPFCSEDCRDEQIRMDQLEERANRRRRAKVTAASAGGSSSAQVKPRAAAVVVGVL